MTATITKGYTFGATELVTNTKLHSLIDSATITGITFSEVTLGELVFYEGSMVSYEDEAVYYV